MLLHNKLHPSQAAENNSNKHLLSFTVSGEAELSSGSFSLEVPGRCQTSKDHSHLKVWLGLEHLLPRQLRHGWQVGAGFDTGKSQFHGGVCSGMRESPYDMAAHFLQTERDRSCNAFDNLTLKIIWFYLCLILFLREPDHQVQPTFGGRETGLELLKWGESKNLLTYFKATIHSKLTFSIYISISNVCMLPASPTKNA